MSAKDEPAVVVVSWNPQWPALARAETSRLAEVAHAVEHVGSTAVPGLPAVPVLDIAVGVDSMADRGEDVANAIESLGYERIADGEGFIRLVRRGDRPVEVHVMEAGGELWKEAVAFRDYLRAHPDEASAYARAKRRAAEGGPTRDVYQERKRPTLETLMRRARSWKVSHPHG
ncbi:MAG TPA: GrpB family protein [Gaiella sp.]